MQDHERCFAGQVSIRYPEGWYWRANAPFIREFMTSLRERDKKQGRGSTQFIHRDPNNGWIWSGPFKSEEGTKCLLKLFADLYMDYMQERHPDVVRDMATQSFDIEEGWSRIN
jgi:hypothetical protein